MEVLLVGINAKYTHSNLAIRYLKAAGEEHCSRIWFREFNINQSRQTMLGEIVAEKAELVGFSCYIWNIDLVLSLAADLKQVAPETTVVLGGPEVSFNSTSLLQRYPFLDYIVCGEGEVAFVQLLDALPSGPADQIPGLTLRLENAILANTPAVVDLVGVPLAYGDAAKNLDDKIVYYETSRGCPFHCAYCLSATSAGVRYFSLERCQTEILHLIAAGVSEIRFVDRTFNSNRQRFQELLQFLCNCPGSTRFQMEVAGDRFDQETIEFLASVGSVRLQFEIGVQSTHPATLHAVGRNCSLDRLAFGVRELRKRTKVRLLLDLIAGMPKETRRTFAEAFDFVYGLKPHRLHVGTLKILHGAPISRSTASFGAVYSRQPPYPVLFTETLSYNEIQMIGHISDLVAVIYDSHRFDGSLGYLVDEKFAGPFDMFWTLAKVWVQRKLHTYAHSLYSYYWHIYDILGSEDEKLLQLLRFDFCQGEARRSLPGWLGKEALSKKDSGAIAENIAEKGATPLAVIDRKVLRRNCRVVDFSFPVFPTSKGMQDKGVQRLLFYYPDGRAPGLVTVVESHKE